MKLSQKQKEVIRLMREGWVLKYFPLSPKAIIVANQGYTSKVSIKTFNILADNNLVSSTKYKDFNFIYKLTDLGKTINI